jgi:hypothetical protein
LADSSEDTIDKLQRVTANKKNCMLERFVNMVNRLSKGAVPVDAQKQQLSDQEIIKSASQCMRQGLPDSFFSAWIEYKKTEQSKTLITYGYKLSEISDIRGFQPADDLYPVQCIEELDSRLSEGKKNWIICTISFNGKTARANFDYSHPPDKKVQPAPKSMTIAVEQVARILATCANLHRGRLDLIDLGHDATSAARLMFLVPHAFGEISYAAKGIEFSKTFVEGSDGADRILTFANEPGFKEAGALATESIDQGQTTLVDSASDWSAQVAIARHRLKNGLPLTDLQNPPRFVPW